MKNSTVSLFESYKQKLPIGQVKLFDWVCSERYKEEAKYIRSLSEKSEQRKYKANCLVSLRVVYFLIVVISTWICIAVISALI